MAGSSILEDDNGRSLIARDGVMLFRQDIEDRLAQDVQAASEPTIAIFSRIIANCSRLPTLIRFRKAVQIDEMLKAGAWTDVSLAVIAYELPAWKMRRLFYEDGEWTCSLSRQPNLPAELDDTVDAHHPWLPLAVMSAFFEARRRDAGSRVNRESVVPKIQMVPKILICCDNFA